jgi:putative redox protein
VVKPPAVVDLHWTHGLVFTATNGASSIVVDGDTREGLSPVQALAVAFASCMSADVVAILAKGRHQIRAFTCHLEADRADDHPRRVTRIILQMTIDGDVPGDAVARAIALSREKYCSVWHSMRTDIELTATFSIRP